MSAACLEAKGDLVTRELHETKELPVLMVYEGFRGDSSKAEQEMGITYTPIHTALDKGITSWVMGG